MNHEFEDSVQSLNDSHTALLDIRSGDQSAIWRLTLALREYLKQVARNELAETRRASGVDDSDLVQRALIKAVQGVHQFRGKTVAEWKAWLAAITRNEARLERRHSSAARRSVSRLVDLDNNGLLANEEPPSAAVRRSELRERLQSAIASLPEAHQQLIRWRHDDALPHSEIASRLGITIDASRQRCKAAMDALRTIFQSWAKGESSSQQAN